MKGLCFFTLSEMDSQWWVLIRDDLELAYIVSTLVVSLRIDNRRTYIETGDILNHIGYKNKNFKSRKKESR